MTERTDLFRREALEYKLRGREASGRLLRLGRPWLTWSFWLVLLLVVIGVAASFRVRIDETASAPAVVDPNRGTFAAVLPVATAPDLAESKSLTLTLPGSPARPVPVDVRHVGFADAAALQRAGLGAAADQGILVTGSLPAAVAGNPDSRIAARATLLLGRERIADVVARQFQLMLGRTGTRG
jgi:hypothetical protein